MHICLSSMCQLLETGKSYLSVFHDHKCVSYWLLVINISIRAVYVGVSGCGCKLRKLLACLLCNFCIFTNCSLSFKI